MRFKPVISGLLIVTATAQMPVFGQRSRLPSPGPQPMSPALGALLQPESVKAILVMYLARSMSKAKATELENELKKTPDKIEARLGLIGYYSWNEQSPADRLRLRTHVLWVIENRPDHAAAAESSLRDLLDDPEGNAMIQDGWNRNLETRGEEMDVLKNAEKFYFSKDPARAELLLRKLFQKDPDNPFWASELTKLYSLFGVPGFGPRDSEERALEAYRRVLELTRNPLARQALAGDMADTEFRSGDYAASARLAEIHLKSSDRSAVQRAHTILGRVALRKGDVAAARGHLLDSASPESARYIAAYSPMLTLAKEMLEKGERDIVVEYLEKCVPLWPRGESVLQIWITDIRNGRTPDFGN